MTYYILDDEKQVIKATWEEYGEFFNGDDGERKFIRVGSTYINDYWVSTVFLGINHNFDDYGEPILFETMIFRPPKEKDNYFDGYQERYCTWDDAVQGHTEAVTMVELRIKNGTMDE